jgi:DNA-directed RNA polymerase omega subunit
MIEPSVEELMNPDVNPDITSKFELVTMVSQRSRQLNDGAELQVDFASLNPVTTALREIVAGGLKLVRNPE